MSFNHTVSIITPSFNRGTIIDETAQSIFNQTYPHWEWVIVDDGSTDDSLNILQQYATKDSRVKVLKREREPKGACACRNIAVENCSGEYLLFLDTDDLLASFCLQQRVDTMQQYPEADFVIFPMLMFSRQPDDLKILWNIDSTADDVERIMTGDAVCQGTGTLWNKKSFFEIGMWNEQLMLWQDIELHLRSLLKPLNYKKRLDLKPDVFLRISDTSLSRTGFHSYAKFLSRVQVLHQTVIKIQERKLLQKYHKGLRSMIVDLFVSAANSKYEKELDFIFKLQHDLGVFNASEEKQLRRYAGIRKSKLYKLPFLQKKFLYKVQNLAPTGNVTLNRIVFTEPIIL